MSILTDSISPASKYLPKGTKITHGRIHKGKKYHNFTNLQALFHDFFSLKLIFLISTNFT